jgi:DNA-binding transcriptional LysR family regulator
MELRDLDYFLACCRTGNFTAAAREVHLVQSAISSAIARLEKDLGVLLFDRSTTPVTLTDHGAVFQLGAQRILDAIQSARDDLTTVSGTVRGTVVLGSTLNTGPLDLAAVLADARRRYPEVAVQLRQSSAGSAGNVAALLDGSVDIALVASPRVSQHPPGMTWLPLVSEPLVFVCRPDHPLAGGPSITVDDLVSEQILRFPPGWGIRDTVDAVLGAMPSAAEVADYGLMLKLVRAGFGTTLMPESTVGTSRGVTHRRVGDPRMHWSLSAAVNAARRPAAATAAVLECLSRFAVERQT